MLSGNIQIQSKPDKKLIKKQNLLSSSKHSKSMKNIKISKIETNETSENTMHIKTINEGSNFVADNQPIFIEDGV